MTGLEVMRDLDDDVFKPKPFTYLQITERIQNRMCCVYQAKLQDI